MLVKGVAFEGLSAENFIDNRHNLGPSQVSRRLKLAVGVPFDNVLIRHVFNIVGGPAASGNASPVATTGFSYAWFVMRYRIAVISSFAFKSYLFVVAVEYIGNVHNVDVAVAV